MIFVNQTHDINPVVDITIERAEGKKRIRKEKGLIKGEDDRRPETTADGFNLFLK